MSYYDNSQWPGPGPASWEPHGQGVPQRGGPGPMRHNPGSRSRVDIPAATGASAPQPQDDFAFSHQFEDVDRAHENLQKSGKGYGMGGRHGRVPHGSGPRAHSINSFDDVRGPQGPSLHNFYASQRQQPSRASNEAEQVMQSKRRLAAQRERELRNLHTEQQYQRNVHSDMSQQGGNASKHMSEEETRELIARQRSALYGEGPFAEKTGYVDEAGNVRPGAPGSGPSGPSSLRGPSPLAFEGMPRGPPGADGSTSSPATDHISQPIDPTSRPQSTASPHTTGPANKIFDNLGPQSRTSTSSPTGASPPRDLAPGSKPGQTSAAVAPIGTRPSGTPTGANPNNKRATTPHTGSGGWGRGNGVWGQSSGLGSQASVWG